MKFLFLYFFILNYIAFTLFAYDKAQAQKKRKRVSEKNLLTLVFFGGTLGAWLGMRKFRHKTLKTNFKLWFYGIALLQCMLFLMVYKRKGFF